MNRWDNSFSADWTVEDQLIYSDKMTIFFDGSSDLLLAESEDRDAVKMNYLSSIPGTPAQKLLLISMINLGKGEE